MTPTAAVTVVLRLFALHRLLPCLRDAGIPSHGRPLSRAVTGGSGTRSRRRVEPRVARLGSPPRSPSWQRRACRNIRRINAPDSGAQQSSPTTLVRDESVAVDVHIGEDSSESVTVGSTFMARGRPVRTGTRRCRAGRVAGPHRRAEVASASTPSRSSPACCHSEDSALVLGPTSGRQARVSVAGRDRRAGAVCQIGLP